MVLIGLVYKHFFENLETQKLPNHVIQVRKKDLTNIQQISFKYTFNGVYLNSSSIDLTKLEKLSKLIFLFAIFDYNDNIDVFLSKI